MALQGLRELVGQSAGGRLAHAGATAGHVHRRLLDTAAQARTALET